MPMVIISKTWNDLILEWWSIIKARSSLFHAMDYLIPWNINTHLWFCMGFPSGSMVKNPPASAGYGFILGLGRSPGGGHGNLLQYSYLENPMNRGAWWATVHGLAKNRPWLSDWAPPHTHIMLQKVKNSSGTRCQQESWQLTFPMHSWPSFLGRVNHRTVLWKVHPWCK